MRSLNILSPDVFIIGAGPAGLAAAIAARQRGLEVLVADGSKPPIDKPCGEGLLPDSLSALKSLGVDIRATDGYPLRSVKFLDARNSACAHLPNGAGIGLRRTVLHERMTARASELGVRFLWNTPVTALADGSVHLAGGESVSARWIVAADGSQSRIRRWAGLDSRRHFIARSARRAHFAVAPWFEGVEVHWCDQAQAYVTPVSATEICVVTASAETAQSPAALKNARNAAVDLSQFPKLAQRLKGIRPAAKERGAIATMRSFPRVYRDNLALIGDASGSIDVITGEGLSLAFRQAAALADAMAQGNLALYERAHRSIARRPAFIGRLLLLLNAHPWLRAKTLAAFARYPEIFERLVAFHVGEFSSTPMPTPDSVASRRYLEGLSGL